HLLETAVTDIEFDDGKFKVKGTDKAIPMTDVAKAFYRPVGPTTKFGTVVDDVGKVINPMICHGQIEGALAQGIGQAIMENVAFDAESGQMLSASFMDYAMPRAADLPLHYEMDFIDVPAKTNPLGVKGVGEAGCVGAPPVVMNAILDALSVYKISHLDMPATSRRVWEAIQKAKA